MKKTPLTGYGVTKFYFWSTVIAYLTPLILTAIAFFIVSGYVIYKKYNLSQKNDSGSDAQELELFITKNKLTF